MDRTTRTVKERRHRDHVLILGRLGPSSLARVEKVQQHTAIPIQVFGAAARRESVQRAESDERRSAHVRERGHHHTTPLHVLRSHRDEGARQEWTALQIRLPGRRALAERRVHREGRDSCWQGHIEELVRSA